MIIKQLNDHCYILIRYDSVNTAADYICGRVTRNEKADPEDDESYWMFYPSGSPTPITAWELKTIFEFVADLNKRLGN